jgi:hypothetical protein
MPGGWLNWALITALLWPTCAPLGGEKCVMQYLSGPSVAIARAAGTVTDMAEVPGLAQ